MNKPDWKDAPPAAMFLAQDGDGSWWWYSRKPCWQPDDDEWYSPYACWVVKEEAAAVNTLERRP